MADNAMDWRTLQVEPSGEANLGPCPHCGGTTRRVWGTVRGREGALAAYFVEWTLGSPEHGANFDLIVGSWGEGTSAADRWASALEYRVVDGEGSFMVTDSGPRPVGSSDLVGTAFRRGDIIGSPRAAVVFAIADAVYAREPRIQEVRQWVTRARPVR